MFHLSHLFTVYYSDNKEYRSLKRIGKAIMPAIGHALPVVPVIIYSYNQADKLLLTLSSMALIFEFFLAMFDGIVHLHEHGHEHEHGHGHGHGA